MVKHQGRGAAAARPGNGWQRVNAEHQHTAPHEFAVRTPTGPHQLPARNSSPVDYFFLLFTVATLRNVLRHTLAYADVVLQDMAQWIERHPASRMKRWAIGDVTLTTLKQYLGLCINMGLLRKKNAKDYWSQRNPSQDTPFFARVMSYRKFALLQRVLHVGVTNPPVQGQPGFDPWSKVRPVLDALNTSFKAYFVPPQHVSIDESMVGMKNRVAYIQYIPNKRHSRFGIKKFELCDALSGYVLHVELYAGKDFPVQCEMGQAHGVVMDLLQKANLLNKGYHLFTDNF